MKRFDFDEMSELAYESGLTPFDFWGSLDDISTGITIREFDIFIRAKRRKFETEMEQLAWVCVNIMNCWTKKPVKMSTLLPRMRAKEKPTFSNPQEFKKEMNRIRDEQESKENFVLVDEEDSEFNGEGPIDFNLFS